MNVYFIGAGVGVLFVVILTIISFKLLRNMKKKKVILENQNVEEIDETTTQE